MSLQGVRQWSKCSPLAVQAQELPENPPIPLGVRWALSRQLLPMSLQGVQRWSKCSRLVVRAQERRENLTRQFNDLPRVKLRFSALPQLSRAKLLRVPLKVLSSL